MLAERGRACSCAQSVLRCSADLEALRLVTPRLGVGDRRVGIDVGGRRGRTPSRRPCSRRGLAACSSSKRAGGAAVAVVVAGHDHGGLLAAREVPEPRQRLAVGVHLRRSGWPAGAAARRPAGSRPCRGRPSPADVAGLRRRRGRRSGSAPIAVALLPGPGRVALAGVDDRPGEVVGEGGRLPAGRCRRCAGSPPGWPSPWSASE